MANGVLVYSAVFGGYDAVQPPQVPGRFVLITDGPRQHGWEWQPEGPWRGPQRTARYWKMRPPAADATVWLDGNISLLVEPETLVTEWLGDDWDVALFAHPGGDCLYAEGEICKHKRKDTAAIIDAQMARYRAAGFPEHFGLGETCVLVRRRCTAVSELNALWWAEIARGSVRDQLSFDYVRWRQGDAVRVRFIDGGPNWRRREHPWFECRPHGG